MSDLDRMNHIIAKFCAQVVREPLVYFSEADLQGLLFAKTVAAFPRQFETKVERGPGSIGKYRTGLVHREYGAGAGRRTDISVFSRESIQAIDRPTLKIGGEYMLPRFAIELGTEKSSRIADHMERDMNKLSRVTERGYLIHFYRDLTTADTGRERRNKKNAKMDREFTAPLLKVEKIDNVCCLGFIIRIGRTTETIRGKCDMFGHPGHAWKTVNLARVEDAAYKVLT